MHVQIKVEESLNSADMGNVKISFCWPELSHLDFLSQ